MRDSAAAIATKVRMLGSFRPENVAEIMGSEIREDRARRDRSPRNDPARENFKRRGEGS